MYDDLIKQLRYCADATTCRNCLWKTECCPTDMQKKAADAIEELKKAVIRLEDESGIYDELPTFYIYPTKWIRVADRLPEDDNRKYLTASSSVTKPTTTLYDICWFAKDLYEVDRFDFPNEKNKPGFYKYDSEYGNYIISDITHWMPLPEPPKDGE